MTRKKSKDTGISKAKEYSNTHLTTKSHKHWRGGPNNDTCYTVEASKYDPSIPALKVVLAFINTFSPTSGTNNTPNTVYRYHFISSRNTGSTHLEVNLEPSHSTWHYLCLFNSARIARPLFPSLQLPLEGHVVKSP